MKLRITIAGITYDADVEVLEDEDATAPYAPPPTHAAAVQPTHTQEHDLSENVCRSPVTGLVIRVPVQAGEMVEAGQLLVLLEAMKMEMQVTAPAAGMVKTIHVAAGNSVKANQPLMEMSWHQQTTGGTER